MSFGYKLELTQEADLTPNDYADGSGCDHVVVTMYGRAETRELAIRTLLGALERLDECA